MTDESSSAPSCSLRVSHPKATAEEIATALDLQPRFRWTVGEPRLGLDGRALEGTRNESYCAFSVPVRALDSLESDLSDFLWRLGARRHEIEKLVSSGAKLAVYVMWTCRSPPGFQFGVEHLKAMADLGVELWLEAV